MKTAVVKTAISHAGGGDISPWPDLCFCKRQVIVEGHDDVFRCRATTPVGRVLPRGLF